MRRRPYAPDRRGPWAIVWPSAGDAFQGPNVEFYRDPRWVIDLLTRWARSRCQGEALQVWRRHGDRWAAQVS